MNPIDQAPDAAPAAPAATVDASLSALDDPRVHNAVRTYLELIECGQRPDRREYLARHAEIANVLAECLDGLEFVQGIVTDLGAAYPRTAASTSWPAPIEPEGPLGDYRIVREVGRGGMGVVYEAVQISLGRRVALKVLPFAAALDAKQLQRFRNEAQSAGLLHHQHIVPVYGVGCERGVHYYAMQFIDGQTLAAVIQEMQQDREAKRQGDKETRRQGEVGEKTPRSGLRVPASEAPGGGPFSLSPCLLVSLSAFYRTVANLGVQAAEGLEHAHQLGVIHRDIKPANLLVDMRGNLWITDFGLAHCQCQAGLTMTGDLLGTLRYMSPEQALGQRVHLDHRTDIYSLGATLYELLTLQPVFSGGDRQELLHQIAAEEPIPPRRINKAIPAELETIVLKAMAKSPEERYATCQELADDLQRFMKDEPIRARRPTLPQRSRRWARRHRTVVWSAAVGLLTTLTMLAGSVGWVVRDRAARQAKVAAEVQGALEEAKRFQKETKWTQAQAAAKRAEDLLAEAGSGGELRQRVAELVADLRMIARLEEVRNLATNVKNGHFDMEGEDRGYEVAFRDYGIDVETLDTQEAAARIQARAIRVELAAALDGWAQKRRWLALKDKKRWQVKKSWHELLSVARVADADPVRMALRDAVLRRDRQALVELANSPRIGSLPAVTLVELAAYLWEDKTGPEETLALLRRAQGRHPEDFWINHALAHYLANQIPPQWGEALPFYMAAVALRPDSARARLNLGEALAATGRPDAGLSACRQALDLKEDYAEAYFSIGLIQFQIGRREAALDAYRQAIKLKPDFLLAQFNLGQTLGLLGRTAESVEAYRRTIELKADFAEAHINLGRALRDQGEFSQSLASLQRGHDLGSRNPNWSTPSAQWVQHGQRLVDLDRRAEAVLQGQVQSSNPAERCEFGQLFVYKKRFMAAARLWADAFSADPKLANDLTNCYRYNAACAAALAGAGQGVDASQVEDKERTRWRKQALAWLRADLAENGKLLEKGKPDDCRLVGQRLRHWQRDLDLAGLRQPTPLPAEEQEACRQFWAEVAALIAKIDAAK